MPRFSARTPRLAIVLLALAALCLLSPEAIAYGPDLCLWRHLFHLYSCPACGSTRALAAFFHGHFGQALEFNRNVVMTAPGLLLLLGHDAGHLIKEIWFQPPNAPTL